MANQKSKVLITSLIIIVIIGAIIFYGTNQKEQEQLNIGIMQIVEHPSLDAARDGFIDVLSENGYKKGEDISYDIQNAQGDMSNANTIAKKFSNDNPDLILSIATPTSQAAANTIKDIPILITAVTAPKETGLVKSLDKPGTNVTGTSDLTPVGGQLELLTQIDSDIKDVGIIYNPGELNSQVQAQKTEEECNKLDLNLIKATADKSSNVQQAAQSLVEKVDAIYVFTDNTVVSALESVIQVAEDNDIPLLVGEPDSVKRGGLATKGLSYYELGRKTGEMALKIIEEDAKPKNMPIQYIDKSKLKLVVNEKAAQNMGVEIPQTIKDKADEVIKLEK